MNILVFVAHSDDQVIGPGGAVAKYAASGDNVFTVICAKDGFLHQHLKEEIITDARVQESEKADAILGGSGVQFLDVPDGKMKQSLSEERMRKQIRDILLKHQPKKIFTHAKDEAHPDHVAVNEALLSVYDELAAEGKLDSAIYSFGIWRLFKWHQRTNPRLVVDITETFHKKIQALSVFKSQKYIILTLRWSVYLKAIISGFRYGAKFVEVFYQLR